MLSIKNDIFLWRKFSWQEFELATADRFNELGFTAENTGFSNDEGVDVIIKLKEGDVLIQCKNIAVRLEHHT